jgi:acetylornithine deacetylase/succinyl-diaminopimelate desuccinylase-like protein
LPDALSQSMLRKLDEAVDDLAGDAFAFLERLVAAPRTAGQEAAAQRVAAAGIPAVAFGPRARNIHAVDEAVELDRIVAGARTLARFLAGYYAAGGLAQDDSR